MSWVVTVWLEKDSEDEARSLVDQLVTTLGPGAVSLQEHLPPVPDPVVEEPADG